LSQAALVEGARAELAAIAPGSRCDRLAEVSALFHAAGTVHLRGRGELAFHLDLASNAIARRAFALLRGLRVGAEVRTYRRRAFGAETRYQLHLDGDDHVRAVLVEAGVLDGQGRPLDRPPGRVVARGCCRGAYLRGAFLGGGSLSGPRAPHLEIRSPSHAAAAFVRAVATSEGVRLRVVDRDGHAAAYAKSREMVEGFLAAAGAVETVLGLEEQALVADLRAEANRLANADHANLVRQSRAAEHQLRAAVALEAGGLLEGLPDPVREAAELRLRHPALSLRELAERADPPATKAAMQRRFAALLRAAGDG
jgi:DNA-binding protein WhiA